MTTRRVRGEPQSRRASPYAPFAVPAVRPEWVDRPRLVDGLQTAGDLPIWVLARAGSGKSTLLAEWADDDPRPAAWVRLSRVHNDPAVLISDLLLAARSVQPPSTRNAEPPSEPTRRDIFAQASRPFVLVLDDVHHVVKKEALDVLRFVAEQIPPGSSVAFAARHEPRLGLPRLRANRALFELDADDLAMTDPEAAALLTLAGIDTDPAVAGILVERTEGWPAGLYLAALGLRGQPDLIAAAKAFAGDDRNVVEYIRDELVQTLPRRVVDFLVHTSILDRLSGSLCDAVLERDDSTRLLDDIHRSNLLLSPLDRNREWFHCHNLVREMLQSELRRRNPELEPVLHARASDWFEARGMLDAAAHHAQAAHDDARVDRLLWRAVPTYLWSGREQSVALLLEAHSRAEIAARPALTVTAACQTLATGEWEEFRYWASIVALAPPEHELPDGTPMRCAAALLRAVLGERGIRQVRDDAALAGELLGPAGSQAGSPLRSVACLLEGSALRLLGELDPARARLHEGSVHGRTLARTVEAQCLAQLAVLAADQGDWLEAAEVASDAMAVITNLLLGDRPAVAMVYAISSLVHAREGAMHLALTEAKHAVFLGSIPKGVAPWFAAETRLLVARTYLHLGDISMGRTLLREAQGILSRAPTSSSWPSGSNRRWHAPRPCRHRWACSRHR